MEERVSQRSSDPPTPFRSLLSRRIVRRDYFSLATAGPLGILSSLGASVLAAASQALQQWRVKTILDRPAADPLDGDRIELGLIALQSLTHAPHEPLYLILPSQGQVLGGCGRVGQYLRTDAQQLQSSCIGAQIRA